MGYGRWAMGDGDVQSAIGHSAINRSVIGNRQPAAGNRQPATGKRQTANGKRQTAERQAANGNRQSRNPAIPQSAIPRSAMAVGLVQ
jgi:hypothetical protein